MSLPHDHFEKNLPFPMRHHPLDHPEPLAPETDPELRRLDAILATALRTDQRDLPPGLVDRLYRASVEYLPVPLQPGEEQPSYTAIAGRIRSWQAWRARVALAACVAAALVLVGIRLASNRGDGGTRERLEGAVAFDCLRGEDADAVEDRKVSHLLDTVGTSLADIEAELVAITAGHDVGM